MCAPAHDSSWITELPTSLPCPPPTLAVAWLRARGRCPLVTGQAGLRPAVPGGRKPRQWALVPCPQAQGQCLGLSAGSLPTLSTPRGTRHQGRQAWAPPGSPAPLTPPSGNGNQPGQHVLLPLTLQACLWGLGLGCQGWEGSWLRYHHLDLSRAKVGPRRDLARRTNRDVLLSVKLALSTPRHPAYSLSRSSVNSAHAQ